MKAPYPENKRVNTDRAKFKPGKYTPSGAKSRSGDD